MIIEFIRVFIEFMGMIIEFGSTIIEFTSRSISFAFVNSIKMKVFIMNEHLFVEFLRLFSINTRLF